MKRFLRDAGILLVFCGTFYFLIVLVGRLDGESDSAVNDFSQSRKRADAFVDQKDWQSAITECETLTVRDPYNGHAWKSLASSLLATRREAMEKLDEIDPADATEAEQFEQQIETVHVKAIEVLGTLSEFARYRPYALLQLAVIESYRGNNDEAMDYLEEFVERGNRTNHGLSNYPSFGKGGEDMFLIETRRPDDCRLHAEERFWYLVRRENQIRQQF